MYGAVKSARLEHNGTRTQESDVATSTKARLNCELAMLLQSEIGGIDLLCQGALFMGNLGCSN